MVENGVLWFCLSDISKYLGYHSASDAVKCNFKFRTLKFRDFKRKNVNVKCNALFTTLNGIVHLIQKSKKIGLIQKAQLKEEIFSVCNFLTTDFNSPVQEVPASTASTSEPTTSTVDSPRATTGSEPSTSTLPSSNDQPSCNILADEDLSDYLPSAQQLLWQDAIKQRLLKCVNNIEELKKDINIIQRQVEKSEYIF